MLVSLFWQSESNYLACYTDNVFCSGSWLDEDFFEQPFHKNIKNYFLNKRIFSTQLNQQQCLYLHPWNKECLQRRQRFFRVGGKVKKTLGEQIFHFPSSFFFIFLFTSIKKIFIFVFLLLFTDQKMILKNFEN